MSQNSNEPRRVRGAGVREDQQAGGSRSLASLPQAAVDAQQGLFPVDPRPLTARPLVLITRGRVEYTAKCPGCASWHRHRHLGDVKGPCGTEYELQAKRGRAA